MELKELLPSIIAVVGLVWGTISQLRINRHKQKLDEESEKVRNLEKLISENKRDLYERVFSYFFDIIKDQKNNNEMDIEQMGQEIIDIKKECLIYSPTPIVKQLVKWQELSIKDNIAAFKEYLKLLHMIRVDLGHDDKLTDNDIVGCFMSDPKDKKQFLELINQNLEKQP